MPGPLRLILGLLCLAMNLYLFVTGRLKNREPWLDLLFRMTGSNFFCFFIMHRINLQTTSYMSNPAPFSLLSWINWSLVIMMFLFFTMAYLTRTPPVARANRLREIILPLCCGCLPMVVSESFDFNQLPFVRDSEIMTNLVKPLVEIAPGSWSSPSIALISVGHLISVWAILHLRRSFAILTEVRTLIRSGPYRYVRHPLYVGENFAAIGFCFYKPSLFNIAVTVTYLVCQTIRASFEEQKFLGSIPEYKDYLEQTGAYLPLRIDRCAR